MSQVPHNPNPASNGQDSPKVRRLVMMACALAISLFILAVLVLYSGWIGQENPSALIVVQGNATVADAFVIVRPLAGESGPLLKAQFKSGDDFRLRFHVPQGRYEVTIHGEGVRPVAQTIDAMGAPLIIEVPPAIVPSSATRPG